MEEGKGAILVGGTMYPGFTGVQQAMEAMAEDPRFQGPGAVAVELGGEPPKGTFAGDYRLTRLR